MGRKNKCQFSVSSCSSSSSSSSSCSSSSSSSSSCSSSSSVSCCDDNFVDRKERIIVTTKPCIRVRDLGKCRKEVEILTRTHVERVKAPKCKVGRSYEKACCDEKPLRRYGRRHERYDRGYDRDYDYGYDRRYGYGGDRHGRDGRRGGYIHSIK